MLKTIQLHTRHTRRLRAATRIFLLALAIVAFGLFLPVQAAPATRGYDVVPPPNGMIDNDMMGTGMMGRDMMGRGGINTSMSRAHMGAMMDQMPAHMNSLMATMPMSYTMPISCTMPMTGMMSMTDMGQMMHMMGMMHQHMGQMQTMMGSMMSACMMESGMMGKGMGEKNATPMPTRVALDAKGTVEMEDGVSRHDPKPQGIRPHS
jgi:hypothetical protein